MPARNYASIRLKFIFLPAHASASLVVAFNSVRAARIIGQAVTDVDRLKFEVVRHSLTDSRTKAQPVEDSVFVKKLGLSLLVCATVCANSGAVMAQNGEAVKSVANPNPVAPVATAPAAPTPPAPAPGTPAAAPAVPGAPQPIPDPTKLAVDQIEKAYEGKLPPEAVKMLLSIMRGSRMGPGEGWFGPADARYSWKWLAEQHGLPDSGPLPKDKFQSDATLFARLDRNQDGKITADDLDWSDNNPWVQQANLVNRMFRRIESNGDGRMTRDDLQKFFEATADGKEYVTAENLRDALLGGTGGSFMPGDAPTQDVLIRGLFAGEVGSLNEGPQLNTQAPLFSLKTHNGKETVHLADLIGKRPVVITFGNFTCGPFRSLLQGVEDVHKRYADQATFIMVYVREAHPTDGWKMESNRRLGVEVAQPKTFEERMTVANQCHAMLKPTMTMLVDEINDSVGAAYSGMPARMYVIDREGKVAYKGGRGPFGFKSGEMEQALIMTLLDGTLSPSKSDSKAKPATAEPAR